MTKLAHQLLEDDRVIISAVGRALSCHVSAAEARRFAWALLADLDPAEADELGYVAPAIISNTRAAGSERSRGRYAWQRLEILEALRDGIDTSFRISNRVGVSANQTSVQLNRMLKMGFIRKVTLRRQGRPGTWGLTDAGRAEMAELLSLQVAA